MNEALVIEARRKQLVYEERRRCWTTTVREELQEQRRYELLWQSIVCGYYQEFLPKHG
jgi:hypothetical protein